MRLSQSARQVIFYEISGLAPVDCLGVSVIEAEQGKTTFNPSIDSLRIATFKIENIDNEDSTFTFAVEGTGGRSSAFGYTTMGKELSVNKLGIAWPSMKEALAFGAHFGGN